MISYRQIATIVGSVLLTAIGLMVVSPAASAATMLGWQVNTSTVGSVKTVKVEVTTSGTPVRIDVRECDTCKPTRMVVRSSSTVTFTLLDEVGAFRITAPGMGSNSFEGWSN